MTKEFGTNVANQESAELVVYESDFMEETFDVDKDFVLGTATLELSENLPVGSPIQVTFTLSTEGILEVSGVDKQRAEKYMPQCRQRELWQRKKLTN